MTSNADIEAVMDSETYFTRHASERCNQRGFSSRDVGVILDYGDIGKCRDDGTFYSLNSKEARHRVRKELGKKEAAVLLAKLRHCYLVMSGNAVLTVAKSYR